VPGFTLSAGRAVRHWRHDEATTIAALEALGLPHDDVVAQELRSPAQIERRARVRGIEVPSQFIDSRRSGTSLVRAENAHAPMPGRDEIVRLFAEALKAL
jgi:hypothetical protein